MLELELDLVKPLAGDLVVLQIKRIEDSEAAVQAAERITREYQCRAVVLPPGVTLFTLPREDAERILRSIVSGGSVV